MVEFEARIGKQTYAPDGSRVNAVIDNPYERVCVSSTSFHEGIHSFLAIKRGVGVRRASRIPGPGYLGVTEPNGFDAVAAVGPDALGLEGGGHDLALASYMGANIDSAKTVARQMVNQDPKGVKRLAVLIERNGTVTGREMERELERGEDVLVTLRRPDGSMIERIEEDVKGEVVMFPFQEYELPKAA